LRCGDLRVAAMLRELHQRRFSRLKFAIMRVSAKTREDANNMGCLFSKSHSSPKLTGLVRFMVTPQTARQD
jgi:hypothetical protein